MPAILEQLQIDHRNMRQLLRVLEEELEAGHPDFDLMRQIVDYALNYPDLIHHPREERLLRRLLERDPASKALVGGLTADHELLAQLTHRFAAALHNVEHDVEVPRALFRKLADDYLSHSRQHMEFEEERFFPRLIAMFDDADWREFDGLTKGYDPLFGNAVERHYRALHERIVKVGF
ncbi:hemerythrin domain-containing protein [Dongia sp.]|uniref:hemerythrin domain-containing protein n=1 Tax=Dongia sp. TaxID=1977262 RepID=UPI003750B2B8